jgi:hypothetical protein
MRFRMVGLFSLVLGSCGILSSEDTVCTSISVPALRVSVVDSLTASPIDGVPIKVLAVDGVFRDSIVSTSFRYAHLAHERPGTYSLEVSGPGYRTWLQERIEVTTDVCHVVPQLRALRALGPRHTRLVARVWFR